MSQRSAQMRAPLATSGAPRADAMSPDGAEFNRARRYVRTINTACRCSGTLGEGALPRRAFITINRHQAAQFLTLASFCRETPEFELGRVISSIKPGRTDVRCPAFGRYLDAIFIAISWSVSWAHVGCNDLWRALPAKNEGRRGIVRLLFVCAMSGPSAGLQSS